MSFLLTRCEEEKALKNAANTGNIDIDSWPQVLVILLQLLHNNVRSTFPRPDPEYFSSQIDPEVVASTPPDDSSGSHTGRRGKDGTEGDENAPPPDSQSSTKENDAPTDIAATRPQWKRPPPPFGPLDFVDDIEWFTATLPPDLRSLYTSTRRTLQRDFSHSPPYTIQRLAELISYPTQHHQYLPAYLRALDRVVNVSSTLSDFPLPNLHTPAQSGFLSNGDTTMTNGISDRGGVGSDESLGGALLTPIPWLRNHTGPGASAHASQSDGELHSQDTSTIDGPNGIGSVETVTVSMNGVVSTGAVAPASPTLSDQSDASSSTSSGTPEALLREQGGVTQGELLRQEQEAGVVPLTQTPSRRMLLAGTAAAVGRETSRQLRSSSIESVEDAATLDDLPHARGPEEIGPEDMGPQHHALGGGLDLEAAVGRGRSKSPQPPPQDIIRSLDAEVKAKQAAKDDSGRPGKDPADVEKEVTKLKEAMDLEKEEEARDEDGDVVVADADGRPVNEKEKMEITGDLGGPDAVDTTTL